MGLRRLIVLALLLVPVAAQAQQFPVAPAHVICDSGCSGGAGGASTIADGADVAEGTTTDVAVQGDNAGTISAKLRGLNKSIAAGLAVTGTFWQTTQPVSFTMPSLVAGTAVIGHVIADSGSTTVVTGNVTVVQPTGTNLHTVVDSAPTTAVTNAGLTNLDVALSTRLKPADTLTGVTTVGAVTSITNPVTVTGTVTTTPPANASTNVAQLAGTTTSTNSGTQDAGTLRVAVATDVGVNSATAALNNAGVTVGVTIGTGNAGCGLELLAGTLAATITFQQSADNATWSNITTILAATLQEAASFTFTNPNALSHFIIALSANAKYVRANVVSYTSGTATAIMTCSPIVSPFGLGLALSIPGQAVPVVGTVISGKDAGGLSRMMSTDTSGNVNTADLAAPAAAIPATVSVTGGADPNGLTRAISTTTLGAVQVQEAPIVAALPKPFQCNAVRKSNCSNF